MYKQISTTQKTFGKQTRRMAKDLCPTVRTIKKVGTAYIGRDENGLCVFTWHPQWLANGLLVIR